MTRTGLLIAGLLAAVAPAAADPALTIAGVNMRTGPGTSYPVVVAVPSGSSVDMGDCTRSGWCAVNWQGRSGYISQNYLDDGGDASPYGAPPQGMAPSGGRGPAAVDPTYGPGGRPLFAPGAGGMPSSGPSGSAITGH